MKKTKLLMPLAGIAAIGATVAPLVSLTSCGTNVSQADIEILETANAYLARKNQQISPHKAVTVLKDLGIDLPNWKLSNTACQFAFDASAKRFIIMKGDAVVASPKDYKLTNEQAVFQFTKTYNKDCKYGQYLLDDFELPSNETELEVRTSIDVGNNQNIDRIKYIGDENNPKNVLLRTYSQVLNVVAKKDTVFHMGIANYLNVNADTTIPDYYEVGWVGYLKTNNVKLNTVYFNKAEGASVDVLDPTNTSKGEKFENGSIASTTDNSAGFEGVTVLTLNNVSNETGTGSFLGSVDGTYNKLQSDITLTTFTNRFVVTKTVILDLNGQTLSHNKSVHAGNIIDVQPGGKLIIIDSSPDQKGTVSTYDSYIKVAGDGSDQTVTKQVAELVIEGGNFDMTGIADDRYGMVKVGELYDQQKTYSGISYSRLYMYGGKITTHLEDGVTSEHANQANGIYMERNSYVQITHGTIESSEVCIRGNGNYSGQDSYIDIAGGTFKQTSPTYGECIYQPQGGSLIISGGTFEGRGCIATKNANVNIAGGFFTAWGEKIDLEPTDTSTKPGQPHDIDGSVLAIEMTAQQYGVNPSITVHNATLYSKNSYILQIYGKPRAEGKGQHLGEADFFGGVYYYAADAGTGSVEGYDGIRIANAVENDVRVNQYGGNWVKA